MPMINRFGSKQRLRRLFADGDELGNAVQKCAVQTRLDALGMFRERGFLTIQLGCRLFLCCLAALLKLRDPVFKFAVHGSNPLLRLVGGVSMRRASPRAPCCSAARPSGDNDACSRFHRSETATTTSCSASPRFSA